MGIKDKNNMNSVAVEVISDAEEFAKKMAEQSNLISSPEYAKNVAYTNEVKTLMAEIFRATPSAVAQKAVLDNEAANLKAILARDAPIIPNSAKALRVANKALYGFLKTQTLTTLNGVAIKTQNDVANVYSGNMTSLKGRVAEIRAIEKSKIALAQLPAPAVVAPTATATAPATVN